MPGLRTYATEKVDLAARFTAGDRIGTIHVIRELAKVFASKPVWGIVDVDLIETVAAIASNAFAAKHDAAEIDDVTARKLAAGRVAPAGFAPFFAKVAARIPMPLPRSTVRRFVTITLPFSILESMPSSD